MLSDSCRISRVDKCDLLNRSVEASMNSNAAGVEWAPPRPIPPILPNPSASSEFPAAMSRIQSFINSFQYNYTSHPFVKPKKTGGSRHMMEIYDRLLALSLPIQCVEAVFIASILTAAFKDVQRLPLSFESKCEGHLYKHIVLAVCCEGKWGSLGISRRSTLMDKPLTFPSLWSLIEEFESSYQAVGHSLSLVAPGAPMPHDFYSADMPILWKALRLRLGSKQSTLSKLDLEKFLQSYSLDVPIGTGKGSQHARKRSNSHAGNMSTPSPTAASAVSHKAAALRSAIAAASLACAASETEVNEPSKQPVVQEQVLQVSKRPPRAASTTRLRIPKERSIPLSSDFKSRANVPPALASVSQPSTARVSSHSSANTAVSAKSARRPSPQSSRWQVSVEPGDDEYQSYSVETNTQLDHSGAIPSSFLPPIHRPPLQSGPEKRIQPLPKL